MRVEDQGIIDHLVATREATKNRGSQRLSWWKRRGERELYGTYQPPSVGEVVDTFDRDFNRRGKAVVTSVIRDRFDSATIYGIPQPFFRVFGKPVEA